MDFPEFAIKHESQWEFQLIILEILGDHTQGWSKNLRFKFFLSIYLLKKIVMLWRFYISITGWVEKTDYWSKISFVMSLKENIVVERMFETFFGSNCLIWLFY